MHVLRTDMMRILRSPGFLAGAACLAVAAFLGGWELLPQALQGKTVTPDLPWMAACAALGSDPVLLLAPAVAALPFSGAFVEDVQTHFVRGALPRCGKKAYLGARTAASALSGALAMLLGAAIAVLAILFLLGPRVAPVSQEEEEFLAELTKEAAAPLPGLFLRFALSGTVWALVGCVLAAMTMNRFMGIAGPFVLYFLLVIICERYFPGAAAISPKNWLAPPEEMADAAGAAALLTAEIAAALCAAYYLTMERRLQNA